MSLMPTEQELKAISMWPLGSVLGGRYAETGVVNRTLLFKTTTGDYVLRTYRPDKPLNEIALEHRMTLFARDNGVPSITPIPLPNGHTVVEIQGRYYSLFTRAQGEQIARDALSGAHLISMGRFLARLNTALQDFPPDGLFRRNFDKTPEQTLQKIAQLEQTIKAWPNPGQDEESALQYLFQQRDYLRYRPQRMQTAGIAMQATHGDFHEGNLFFHNYQVSAIIDWDQVRMGPRSWDAIRYANFLLLMQNPQLVRMFIEAYVQNAALQPGEFERTVQLFGAYHAHDTWALEAVYLENNPKARVFISPIFMPFEEHWAQIRPSS